MVVAYGVTDSGVLHFNKKFIVTNFVEDDWSHFEIIARIHNDESFSLEVSRAIAICCHSCDWIVQMSDDDSEKLWCS